MSPSCCLSVCAVCLVLWSLNSSAGMLGIAVAASIQVGPPQNVAVVSLNTNYTLIWDRDQYPGESNVTFTVQFVASYVLSNPKKEPKWATVCEETVESCGLAQLELYYLGKYTFRIRANTNGHHSEWIQKEFCPEKDASLGPPAKVELGAAGNLLDVQISEPLTVKNTSMRIYLSKMYYNIVYWEHVAEQTASRTKMLQSNSTLVTLQDLRARTWYCVSVQSRNNRPEKRSNFTTPSCLQTEGNIPWWQIFLCFLASLFLCFLTVLLLIFCCSHGYKIVKTTFFPSNQLPPHLREYLCGSHGSDLPHLFTPSSQSELLCDTLTICAEPVLQETHPMPPEAFAVPPSGLVLDSSVPPDVVSGRHSRQDSSSSGDSGVYSAAGSGGLQRTSSSKASTGGQHLQLRRTFDPEPMTLQDMKPCLQRRPVFADEGLIDACV